MKQEQIFQIFGHITVLYSTLDFIVTGYILDIVNETYKSQNKSLSDNTTLGKKLEIIKRLKDADVISVAVLNKTKEFIDEAIAVSKERNRFIHDQWLFDPVHLDEGKITRISIINTDKWIFNTENSGFYSLSMFDEILNRLGKLQCQFWELRNKLISGESAHDVR